MPLSSSSSHARSSSRPSGTGVEALTAYMAQVRHVPLLTREEEVVLAQRWQEDRDPLAAQRLITANLRFVVKVALGYRKYGLPLADIVQEGNMGLIQAVDRFNPSRGTRLISYAVWWIRAYIQNHVLKSWSLVRVGTTHVQRRLFYRLPGATAALRQVDLGEQSLPDALASQLHTRRGEVEEMMGRMSGRDLSLDAPFGEDGPNTPLERLADLHPDPEEAASRLEIRQQRRQQLEGALLRLSPRERLIVEQRHLDENPRTLQEVGEQLGLSRERVRQLESIALARLRRTLVKDAA